MKQILANLSTRQKISIVAVALLVGVGLFLFIRNQRERDFKPLFTGLAPEDAAGIVQKLKESGVEFRLPDGGSAVLVPSARLAELRLGMAAAGLPKTGRIGFELFDKTNLGATEFTEHVNYRRALEGELERSVMALTELEQARVHLTFPKDSVFLESRQPAKASVLVKLRPRARLAPENVVAIAHLVSSAVEGLTPDAVSVLDMNGNLLSRPKARGSLDGPEPSEATLDYRQKIEADLLVKINSTLEPLLGPNRYRAGVSVECDFTSGEQSEELFDPARSVMLSSQRSEDSSGSGGANGVPGTASTLPRPTSRPGAASRNVARMTENITYQSSRTIRKTRLATGGLTKMSVAVLLDQEVKWEKEQSGFRRVLVPPTPEKLKVIRELVAGVVGFNATRGDQLVIDTLPFETTLMLEPPAPPVPAAPQAPSTSPLDMLKKLDRRTLLIAGGAAGGVLLLLMGLFLLLLKRRRKKRAAAVTGPQELAAAENALAPVAASDGDRIEHQIETRLAEREALQQKMDAQALTALKLAPVITKTAEVLAKHLRDKVKKESEVSAQILRAWVREEEG
jgi:flagellar M-ring protein FliF